MYMGWWVIVFVNLGWWVFGLHCFRGLTKLRTIYGLVWLIICSFGWTWFKLWVNTKLFFAKSLKKGWLCKGKWTRRGANTWCSMVSVNYREVLSPLATCRKENQCGDDEGWEKNTREGGSSQFCLYFKMNFFRTVHPNCDLFLFLRSSLLVLQN
jgi:hypothetical protein